MEFAIIQKNGDKAPEATTVTQEPAMAAPAPLPPSETDTNAAPLAVCCVIGALTPGGSERQMLGILQQLDRRRFRPHLFTFYRHGSLGDQVPADVPHFCYEEQVGPLRNGWIPGGIQRKLSRRLAQYLLEQQIDVVYDRTFPVAWVTGPACLRTNTAYINTIVENPYRGFATAAGRGRWWKYQQLRRIYRHAAAVLSVSQGLTDAASRYFRLPAERFTCCYNFVDPRRLARIDQAAAIRRNEMLGNFAHGVTSDRQKNSPAGRPLRLVAIGRLHWQKGLDYLLRAVAELHGSGLPLELQLVGDGPAAAELRQLAAELRVQDKVQWLGWHSEPIDTLAQTDLLVLPSLTEGLPNSLLEALLVGVPAIASDCDYGPRELTEAGRWATLVPPGDVTALAREIAAFFRDPTVAQARAAEARQHLRPRFAPELACRQLEAHLLAATPPNPGASFPP